MYRPQLKFASARLGSVIAVATALGLTSCSSTTTPTDPNPDPDPATLSVTIAPTSGSIVQGGSTAFDGTATMGGTFSGAVTFAVTGLPAGVTVTIGTVQVSGTMATAAITIDVAGSVAAGSYSGTVTASGSGTSATATYALTVTDPAPASQITLDFSTCTVDEQPVWVAYSNGIGAPWMVSPNVSNTYTFTGLTQTALGLAVVLDAVETDITVNYIDITGMSGTVDACETGLGKTVNGTVAGVIGFTTVTLGRAPVTSFFDGPFSITGVEDGPLPLVGYSVDGGGSADRMIILRDQDIVDGGDIGTIDFMGAGFDPLEATITIGGLVGGENGAVTMDYAAAISPGMCGFAPLYSLPLSSTFAGRSATPAQQMAGDFHVAGAAIGSGTELRWFKESFSTLAPRTINVPAALPVPTLTDVTGSSNYLRLEADFSLPVDYDLIVYFDYTAGTTSLSVYADGGLLTGDVTLTIPDFTGLAGWDDAWALPTNATGVDYVTGGVGGVGGIVNATLCSDGGRWVVGAQRGTYN